MRELSPLYIYFYYFLFFISVILHRHNKIEYTSWLVQKHSGQWLFAVRCTRAANTFLYVYMRYFYALHHIPRTMARRQTDSHICTPRIDSNKRALCMYFP